MRWWVYQNDTYTEGPSPDIKIFIIYHDSSAANPLEDSLGIRKGLFGVVHAYANRRLEQKNHVVIAHEILHTVGAKDKYDLATKQPLFPAGYADPENQPLFPQQFAEIMGSRIPLSKTQSKMPPTLNHTIIGEQTAREIVDWLFPGPEPVRMPTVAVTGTNGKTTTTRMINQVMANAGRRTGLVCTTGVYLDGKPVHDKCSFRNDCILIEIKECFCDYFHQFAGTISNDYLFHG